MQKEEDGREKIYDANKTDDGYLSLFTSHFLGTDSTPNGNSTESNIEN